MEENVRFPLYSTSNETSKEMLGEDLDLGLRQNDQRKKATELSMGVCQELGNTSVYKSKNFPFTT